MNQQDAESVLREAAEAEDPVVQLASGSMGYIKELHEKCLGAEIPAALSRPPGKGSS